MAYQADPGGVFESDVHRRTLGHLTDTPMTAEDLAARMGPDQHTDLDVDEATSVLEDLEADGYASKSAAGWKQTKKGLDALCAPVPGSE